jgi:hypothetical protein
LDWKQVADPLALFDKIYAVLNMSIKPRVTARDHHDKDRPLASSRNEGPSIGVVAK